jgi:hypothetical protein
MRIVYLSPREKALAMFRQCIKALRGRLTDFSLDVRPGQARAVAAQKVRALDLVLDGPAAVYTRMFQCALEDACQVGPGGAFSIRELPQRVDYDCLREVGVSEKEIAGLHERLARECAQRGTPRGGWLRHRLAAL